jgi:hypothetical protein
MDDFNLDLMQDLDIEDYQDNFIERFDDLVAGELFWEVREALQEELYRRVNERNL